MRLFIAIRLSDEMKKALINCRKNSLQCIFICDILRMLQKNTYADFSDGAKTG